MQRAGWAGVVWVAGAASYLAAEAVAASGYQGYSYVEDYISDLGVPQGTTGTVGGHVATVMNLGFVANGAAFLVAALLVTRAGPGRGHVPFVGLAAVHAVGNLLVAAVHSGGEDTVLHTLGAGLAIVGGNLAVAVAGLAATTLGVPRWYGAASTAAGVLGLVALTVLVVGPDGVPVGVAERSSVYTIIGWQLGTGAALLGATAPDPHATGGHDAGPELEGGRERRRGHSGDPGRP